MGAELSDRLRVSGTWKRESALALFQFSLFSSWIFAGQVVSASAPKRGAPRGNLAADLAVDHGQRLSMQGHQQ
jgi:hypothetical protein